MDYCFLQAPAALTVELQDLFTEEAFEVVAGQSELLRDVGGLRQRWSIDSMSWVSAAE